MSDDGKIILFPTNKIKRKIPVGEKQQSKFAEELKNIRGFSPEVQKYD